MTNAVFAPSRRAARKVSSFVSKTYALVSAASSDDAVRWTDSGAAFVIADELRLGPLLPLYFAHDNVASFVRQLNNYGFHGKKTGLFYRFEHPHFRAGAPDELAFVQRKVRDADVAAAAPRPRPGVPPRVATVNVVAAATPALPAAPAVTTFVAPAGNPESGACTDVYQLDMLDSLFAEVDTLRAQVDSLDVSQQTMGSLVRAAAVENERLRADLCAAREAQAVLGTLVDSVATLLRSRCPPGVESKRAEYHDHSELSVLDSWENYDDLPSDWPPTVDDGLCGAGDPCASTPGPFSRLSSVDAIDIITDVMHGIHGGM